MKKIWQNLDLQEIIQEKSLRVTWILILVVNLLLLSFYFFFYRPSLSNIDSRISTSQYEVAENTRLQLENYLDENIKSFSSLGQIAGIIHENPERKAIIKRFMKEKKWINQVSIVDMFGYETLKISQLYLLGPDDLKDVSKEEIFTVPLSGSVYLSPINYSEKAAPYFIISLPIKSSPEQISGVLVLHLSLQEIEKIIKDIKVEPLGKIYLVDRSGRVAVHQDARARLARTDISSRKAVAQLFETGREVIGTSDEYAYINEDGKKSYIVGVPLRTLQAGIFVETPVENAWAIYQKIKTSGLILSVVIVLLLIVLAANAAVLAKVFIDLKKGRESLGVEVEKRTHELVEMDRIAQLLVKRDLEITNANSKLDKKIQELEESKKSLMKALNDVESARQRSDEERDKNLAIISNLTDPILVLDKNDSISLYNTAAEKTLGLIYTDIGKKVSSLNGYSLENFKEFIRRDFTFKKIEQEGAPESAFEEMAIKLQDSETNFKVMTAKITAKNQDNLGVMKMFYDLTREKMIDRMKSEFISIAAHQLRTPLSAIKWIIKMVYDGDAGELNPEQKELLYKGYQSNERIIGLVNDLLNVSRIEEGKFGYNFTDSDLQDVLNMLVENYEKLIAKNHLKFTINKPDKLPKIYMDKERIGLVMQNLLENSIKYTPPLGHIEINIELPDNKMVKICIKDNGVGIPAKDQQKLFSKFFRAENVIRMETEGTGLGLFIAKNIINKHGGKIYVKSQEGMGTEIGFTMPLFSSGADEAKKTVDRSK